MKPDWRILASATFFTVLGATLLSTTRISSQSDEGSDPFAGKKTTVNARDGLVIELSSSGVDVLVENCNTQQFSDKFLLHATPVSSRNIPTEGFHNFDFQLNKVKGFEITRNGGKYCLHPISFNRVKVREIRIGQFSMPGGQCCEILWSTNIKL